MINAKEEARAIGRKIYDESDDDVPEIISAVKDSIAANRALLHALQSAFLHEFVYEMIHGFNRSARTAAFQQDPQRSVDISKGRERVAAMGEAHRSMYNIPIMPGSKTPLGEMYKDDFIKTEQFYLSQGGTMIARGIMCSMIVKKMPENMRARDVFTERQLERMEAAAQRSVDALLNPRRGGGGGGAVGVKPTPRPRKGGGELGAEA